jgi:hypothetical protein
VQLRVHKLLAVAFYGATGVQNLRQVYIAHQPASQEEAGQLRAHALRDATVVVVELFELLLCAEAGEPCGLTKSLAAAAEARQLKWASQLSSFSGAYVFVLFFSFLLD